MKNETKAKIPSNETAARRAILEESKSSDDGMPTGDTSGVQNKGGLLPPVAEGGDTKNNKTSVDENSLSVEQGEYVVVLQDDDVLLGRGTGPNEYIGNIRFRNLVRQVLMKSCCIVLDDNNEPFMEEKKTANRTSSSPECRLILARQIVQTVESRGGRFLERVPGVNAKYHQVEDSVAVEKVRQSFRHQIRSMEKEERQTICATTPPPFMTNKRKGREEDYGPATGAGSPKYRRLASVAGFPTGAAKYDMRHHAFSRPLLLTHHHNTSGFSGGSSDREKVIMVPPSGSAAGDGDGNKNNSKNPQDSNHSDPTSVLSPQVVASLLSLRREAQELGGMQQQGRYCYPPPLQTFSFPPGLILLDEQESLRRACLLAAAEQQSLLCPLPVPAARPLSLLPGNSLWAAAAAAAAAHKRTAAEQQAEHRNEYNHYLLRHRLHQADILQAPAAAAGTPQHHRRFLWLQ